MVSELLKGQSRQVFGGISGGSEEFLEVSRPGWNSFNDVDFQNLITIFLLNQSFIR